MSPQLVAVPTSSGGCGGTRTSAGGNQEAPGGAEGNTALLRGIFLFSLNHIPSKVACEDKTLHVRRTQSGLGTEFSGKSGKNSGLSPRFLRELLPQLRHHGGGSGSTISTRDS